MKDVFSSTYNTMTWIDGNLYHDSMRKLFANTSNVFFMTNYNVWKKNFTYIHGQLDSQRKINIEALENKFQISLDSNESVFSLIFCLETYYSIILRIIGFKAIEKNINYSESLFDDTTYKDKGIKNYKCKEYYDWFLNIEGIQPLIKEIFAEINIDDIRHHDDFISIMYEKIFPKQVRHGLGEYYTPFWLSSYVIEAVTLGDTERAVKKYIDPSCGVGTFLVALIKKFKVESENSIFSNICGIDINPLTVLAAKTNFLLYYSEEYEINNQTALFIPIYEADTIAINEVNRPMFAASENYDAVPKIKYDYIVGNPPWVNWEYLPKEYKYAHTGLWKYYNLYAQKGISANFIKEDVSVLMTYVVVDNYLRDGGRLGFLVKETLFKSIKQGEGFRSFRIQPKNVDLKVFRVDDLVSIKPFKDAATRTAILFLEKGKKTEFPVDYIVWKKTKKNTHIDDNINTYNLSKYFDIVNLKARPSVSSSPKSGWITEGEEDEAISSKVLGQNNYTARTGVFTGGANGIYWLQIDDSNDKELIVHNITDHAKNKVKKISVKIEKDFVFPFLTGKELNFWNYSYSKYILCPHTSQSKMYPIDKGTLKHYPYTEQYFNIFKEELESRKGFTSFDKDIHNNYYYALQRIGEYTFAPYKVSWRYIAKDFTPAVIEYADDKYLGNKNIICNEKIISIGLNNRDEAYFLCGIISSKPYRKTIESFMVGTQITPSIINRLYIPKYDKDNPIHKQISNICYHGHQVKEKSPDLEKIDDLVNTLLNEEMYEKPAV